MTALKDLRLATGRSRSAVAADLDMSERHLYRLENGAPLRRTLALAFAVYYGVPVDEIDEARTEAA